MKTTSDFINFCSLNQDSRLLKNRADLNVYEQLLRIDKQLGSSGIEQLFSCVRRALSSNFIKELIQIFISGNLLEETKQMNYEQALRSKIRGIWRTKQKWKNNFSSLYQCLSRIFSEQAAQKNTTEQFTYAFGVGVSYLTRLCR